MDFRVLGSVAAFDAGTQVEIKSGKVVELLTVLLLAPGFRASHEAIASYMWPDEDPKANRIRQCFHQLRQVLPAIAPRNESGFCRIQVAPRSIDYVRFKDFRRAADSAESPSARLAALRSALAESRGDPLAGLSGAGFERRRAEIDAELHAATTACVAAELDCGQPRAALDRAEEARRRWPASERLLELTVRAMRTLGQQDRVEPQIDRWERCFGGSTAHLLLADVEEPDHAVAGPVLPPSRSGPRQLPSQSAHLVGRRPHLDRLTNTLLGRTPGRSRLALLTGMPGVGKTFLAVWTASHSERFFPDGVLYVDLGGFSSGEPERHGRVLARFLNDLRVRIDTPTLDGMVSTYRTALAERATLLVLDNARDEDHVRPLLPGLGASAAIVTSRCQLAGLVIREGADAVDLAPLDREDSAELLRTRLGEDRMRTARPFVDDLIEHCAGVPLALGIMAARIARRPRQALPAIARELREERTRLRSLDLGSESLSVRLSLEVSHRLLPEPAARLFWQLAVHPGPTVSWMALRAFDPDHLGVSDAIDYLVRMSLVTEPVPERYALHDLVRVYAAESASRQDEPARAQVAERVLRFLLHNAWSCDRKLDPGRRLPIGDPREVDVVAPSSAADAMAWFEAEYSTLTAAIRLTEEYGFHRYAWLLPMSLVTFQWRSGRHLDALTHLTGSLDAARREGTAEDVAMVHRMLAGTHRGLGDLALATWESRRAVQVSEDNGDVTGIALGRHALGVLLRETGASGEAVENFSAALSAFELLSDTLGRGAALNGLGDARYDLGWYDEGLEHCLHSLTLLEGTDDFNGQAHALFSRGRIQIARGEYRDAVLDFERARGLYRSLAYGSREARTLVWLADAHRRAGRTEKAEEAITSAHDLLGGLGEHDLAAAVERLRCLP